MAEQHILYAVVRQTPTGVLATPTIQVRVSKPLDWNTAIDLWKTLDDLRFAHGAGGSGRLTVARMPVVAFAVRAADDPDWPIDGPLCKVQFRGDFLDSLVVYEPRDHLTD